MGLITYTNIEDNTTAAANDINERFGNVVDEVNGHISSQNLENGAVITAKIADGAVTSSKIATDKYIDANGWTVNNLGTSKTYTYTISVPSLLVQNGQRNSAGSIAPPVGRTRDNIIMTCTWYGNFAGHAIPGVEPNGDGTSIQVQLSNQYYLGALTFNGKIYITAVEAL